MSEVARLASLQAHLGHPTVDVNGPNNHPPMPAPPPLNDLRQEIQECLDVLEMKELEIFRERLELKSRWNHSLAVTQLPNEILYHIFVYVSEQPKPPRHWQDYRDDEDDKSASEFGLAKTGWTKLMLVCRRWCDVARATPALWRTIDVGKTSNWMKLALTHSGGATINVSFPYDFSEEHASLLQPHCHRLHALRLRSWSPYALRVIRNILPALETLEIHSNPGGMKAALRGFYTDLRITRKGLPNLRTLQLAYTIIPRDPLFYARLCKLSLKACPFRASVDQFVQLLATSLCLEHLELDESLQNLSDSGNAGPAWPLASLLSLRLSNHLPAHSARFLSRVVIPKTASLSIKAHVGLAEEERGDTLRAIVPPAQNLASSFPGLTTVTFARLVATWEEYAIECPSTQLAGRDEALLIELALTSASTSESAGVGWADCMPDGLADLLALFGSAPLTHLEVVGNCSTVEAETWARVFRAFPSLVSLEADADGALFAGLHEASLASAADEPVACRGLERMAINDDWAALGRPEWVLDPLIRCLRYRAERGSRLKELRVGLHQHTVDDIEVYLAQLEALVLKVDLRYAYAFAVDHEERSDEEGEESDGESRDGSDDEE